MINEDTLVILVAPNVGEQMGGEAIKALQIFREVRKLHPNTLQITHERNRDELSRRLRMPDVHYVSDTAISVLLWRSRVLQWLVNPWFSREAIRLAESIATERGLKGAQVIIHQTEPNSPVVPRSISQEHPNIFGPINGNIYYPDIFRHNERVSARLRRIFHMPAQRLNRLLFAGITKADLILCAGGPRTRNSLLAAGCSSGILVDSLDCGISDAILDRPRIVHSGTNFKFVHFGRLVFHKGTSLIIEALAQTGNDIRLDIIGTGPELGRCRQLVAQLGLGERVTFLGWFPSHSDLLDTFRQYRGALLPSIEDANGIVVQEAMALGLPCICLDWGGPQLLVQNGVSGYLIEPQSRVYIVEQIATCLDRMASDSSLAERMSLAARQAAEQWRWSRVASSWLSLVSRAVQPRHC
jgi:glycosyltransferase involved in cell wall biosynthesis